MKITIPSDVLVRSLKAVLLSASTDGSRPHLNAVWIRVLAGKTPHLWATNGHWISAVRLDAAEVVEPGFVGTSVDDVKRLLALAPSRPMATTITNDGTSTTFEFVGFSSTTVRAIAATPPPAHTIVPDRKSTAKHKRAGLSIKILGPVLSALKELSKGRTRETGVRFYAMGATELDPQVVWSAECPEYFALCMPMRTGGKRHDSMRWWHDASKDIEAGIAAAKCAAQETASAAAE